MAPDEDFTPAEMRRWLERLERQVTDGFKATDGKITNLQREVQQAAFVPIPLYQSERDAERRRVDERFSAMDQRFDAVDTRLGNVRGTAFWVAGFVVAALTLEVTIFKAFGL